MDKKTIRIIAILITTAICGFPGLCGLCFGSLALLGALSPDTGIPKEDVALTAGISVMMLGISLVIIAIPIGIVIWTWWSTKPKPVKMDEIFIPEEDF